MSDNQHNKKIVLVRSGYKGGYVHIPLGILYLAEALIKNGYEPRLIDLRIQELVPEDLENVLYMGVSHMTGSMQIPPALKCASLAKGMGVPVVFGGPHSSILPEQTAAHPLVDIAVKGDGEEVAVELAQYFEGQRDLASIKSIAYKDSSGKVIFTGDRNPPPFNQTTFLPYELLPMNKYLATSADFDFQTSRGCPHHCAFCAEISLFGHSWRAKPAQVIVEEVESVISRYNPSRILIVDSNFFCNKKRVREFCELVIERGIKTWFFAECRFDYFSRYEDEFLYLLKKAGFTEIEFGGESGSNVTLARIKKDVSSEQILQSIKKCHETGLKSFTSFMIGFPEETDEQRMETLDIYDQIRHLYPSGARINGMFIYSPFPGTELYDNVVERHGFVPPRDLDGWAKFELYDSKNVTWLDEPKKKELQTVSILVRYFFTYKTIRDWSFKEKRIRHHGFIKAVLSLVCNGIFYPFAKLRWKFRVFRYGIEWRIWQKIFSLYMGQK